MCVYRNFGDNAFPVLNTITADKLHVLQQDLRRKVPTLLLYLEYTITSFHRWCFVIRI